MSILRFWTVVFLLVVVQQPATAAFNPAIATAGGPAFQLTASASDVTADMVLWWNGSPRASTSLVYPSGGASIVANITAADIAKPGVATITFQSPLTGIASSAVLHFPVVIAIEPSDLVFDSGRELIYASLSTSIFQPNQPADNVVAIDPESGSIKSTVAVAGSPGPMAISDDGKYLYVGRGSDNSVVQIDLDSFTIVSSFQAGSQIVALAVMPGHPATVAVGQSAGTTTQLPLTIFDNGVPRMPSVIVPDAHSLFFNSDGTLYAGAFCNPYCGPGISQVTFGASGTPSVSPVFGDGSAFGINNGLLYSTTGHIWNLTGFALAGDFGASGAGFLLPLQGRALLANGDLLMAFDMPSQLPLGALSLADSTDPLGFPPLPERLLQWGADEVAFTFEHNLLSFHTPLAGPAPSFPAGGVVNSASGIAGAVAPGEIISIYGQNLAPSYSQSSVYSALGQLASQLGGVQVWFDTFPGIVLFTSAGQINVVAPFELEGSQATSIQVLNSGIPSPAVSVPVNSAAPGIYTLNSSGSGPGAVINQDGSINASSSPAPRGSTVAVYATGGGQTTPAEKDGRIVREVERLIANPSAQIGGIEAQVYYAGGAPGLVSGALQVNVTIPANAPTGDAISLLLSVAGAESQKGVTIAVQ
jgi:uncharacterized protein (TIGR03437 family)